MKKKNKRVIQKMVGWLRLLESQDIKGADKYFGDTFRWGMYLGDGLCAHLSDYYGIFSSSKVYDKVRDFVTKAMGEWPEGTRNSTYPVPHHEIQRGVAFRGCKNKYDKRTKYGRARMRLAGYVADQLEKKYL